MNFDHQKNDPLANQNAFAISDTGTWKVIFFIWLIIGYIICLPIASLASMVATFLGIAVCGIYFLLLRVFTRASINEYGAYLDSLTYAHQHNRLSVEDLSRYQRKFQELQRKKTFWKYAGMIIFILYILAMVVFCFNIFNLSDAKTAADAAQSSDFSVQVVVNSQALQLIINAGVCLMTLIMCIFPSYMYQQVIDFLEANDLRHQLK